nr:retrovirus-related Pol polyprotein from transposon TNT 1-94 [Tanacetum cinerariifolium]
MLFDRPMRYKGLATWDRGKTTWGGRVEAKGTVPVEKGKNKKGKSKQGLIAESFDWDEESVSLEDERTTNIRAFMEIAKDEPSVGKTDARSGQWVDITMKDVYRLLSMTDGDERKYVLNYTYVDLNYVEDHRKNLLNKFNLLIQTCSKVTLDQLLYKKIPGNIVKALGGRGKRKEKIYSKEVIFTKADDSLFVPFPKITSDSESECETQEPLPSLPKLIGAALVGTSDSLISLSDLTLNMADLTLNTFVLKKTKPISDKVSPTYVIKKETENKSPAIPKACHGKNVDSSIEKLLLTLMEEECIKRSVWYLDSGCSRHMTRVKQYLHRYSKESGPNVVFRDDYSGDTEGYGSVNFNGITFTRVAYVKGLKHSLIIINQQCDANFKVLFTETHGTIFNQNDEVVLIVLRKRDLYIIDIKMENLNKVKVKELRSDNEIESRTHNLEEFYDEKGISYNFSSPCTPGQNGKFDEKADDGFFLGCSLVSKAFRVFNIRRQEMEETVHVTFSEDDELISQSSTEGDAINFIENRSFLDDEFLKPKSKDSVSSEEPPKFTVADDHPAPNELDQPESPANLESAEIQDIVIVEPISDVQPSPILSPLAEGILQPPAPQDR